MERSNQDYKYDIAISYSREDAALATELAYILRKCQVRVFFEEFDEINLWSKNLHIELKQIYKDHSFCVIALISNSYSEKEWTMFELKSALEQDKTPSTDYILPVKVDNTKIPLIPPEISYLEANDSAHELAIKTLKKLELKGVYTERSNVDLENYRLLNTKLLTQKPETQPGNLIGREGVLEEIHKVFKEKRLPILINGIGGVGKTALASAYATKYFSLYKKIVWITQTQNDLRLDFIQNGELTTSLEIKTDGIDIAEQFDIIKHRLNSFKIKPKLIVIDNTNNESWKHLKALPSQPAWHLLITSRELISEFYRFEVDLLSEENSVKLFRKYCDYPYEEKDIIELVQIVEYHTLTIEILSKTAKKLRLEPVELKSALLVDREVKVKTIHSDKEPIERITSYLSKIFDISKLDYEEVWMIKQFAALPSAFHTYNKLQSLINPKKGRLADSFNETLNSLEVKGWLSYNTGLDSYRMHSIVKDTIRTIQNISSNELSALISNLDSLLKKSVVDDNAKVQSEWAPFGISCLEAINKRHELSTASLKNHLALALESQGEFTKAKELLIDSLETNKIFLEAEAEAIINNYLNLPSILINLRELNEAWKYAELACNLCVKKFGEKSTKTALAYSNTGFVLQELERFQEAKTYLQRSVDIYELNLGESDKDTIMTYALLASVMEDLGDYETPKSILRKALDFSIETLGPEHPSLSKRYSNLAHPYFQTGEGHIAKDLLLKAVELDEKNLGVKHPDTARRYNNLALTLERLGDFEEALPYAETSFKSKLNIYPEGHKEISEAHNTLGTIQLGLRDFKSAVTNFKTALNYDLKTFGDLAPKVALRYCNLAVSYRELGEFSEALECAEKGHSIYQKTLSERHYMTQNALQLLWIIQNLASDK